MFNRFVNEDEEELNFPLPEEEDDELKIGSDIKKELNRIDDSDLSIGEIARLAKLKGSIENTNNEKESINSRLSELCDKESTSKEEPKDEDDENDERQAKSFRDNIAEWINQHLASFKTLLIIIVIVIVCVGFKKLSSGKETKQSEKEPHQQSSTETENVSNSISQKYIYDEYYEIDTSLYEDEMVVSKFILTDDSTCLYYFSGIPMHFKRKIVFPVSYNDYNKVGTGGKVLIEYKIVPIDGNDKVSDVRIIMGG